MGHAPLPVQSTLGIKRSLLVLTAVVAVVFPGFAWFGHVSSGAGGVIAAVIAAVVCFLASASALVVTFILRGPATGVSGVLLGMMFQSGLPMASGVLLTSLGGPVADAGVFGMIVGYFLVTLATNTVLLVLLVGPGASASKAGS